MTPKTSLYQILINTIETIKPKNIFHLCFDVPQPQNKPILAIRSDQNPSENFGYILNFTKKLTYNNNINQNISQKPHYHTIYHTYNN